MIYLIKSSGYKEEEEGKISTFFLLKIGYTEDNSKDKRFFQYKLHNPTCQILYEIPDGTEDQEKRIQYRFRDLLFPDYGREWFKYSEEIIEFFKNIKSLKDIENYLPKGNSSKKKYLKYKNNIKEILKYISNIPCRDIKKFNILCEEIFDILGDKIIDNEYTMDYLKLRFGEEKIEEYNKIIESRNSGIYCDDLITNQKVSRFMEEYNSLSEARKKLILLCESNLSSEAIQVVLAQIPESDYIRSYYENLGPQRLKALGYRKSSIEKELGIVTFSWELLRDSIYSEFKEGEKYSLSNLKDKLGSIYSSINYKSTPKANDIENWFETRVCQVSILVDNKKKRVNCLELLKSKRNILEERLVD